MANELIAEFGETISVSRTAAGSYVSGVFVPGAASTLTPRACVEPMEPEEVVALDLGERVKAGITVYTETQLMTVSEAAAAAADVITWQGQRYQVHSVAYRYQQPGLEHYRVTAVRVEAAA